MPGVRYLRKIVNDVLVVAAAAEIDTTAVEQLRAVLLDSAARGHTTIVVDMTGTVCCDSSGLHTLLRAHKRAVAEGGELRLVVPSEGAVPRTLNLTGLDLFFPCFSSLAESMAPTPAPAIQHN